MRLKPLAETGDAEPVMGYIPSVVAGVRRVMALIDTHDLSYQPEPRGTDLAVVGDTKLDLDVCRRALSIVRPISLSMFPANFDRPSEEGVD